MEPIADIVDPAVADEFARMVNELVDADVGVRRYLLAGEGLRRKASTIQAAAKSIFSELGSRKLPFVTCILGTPASLDSNPAAGRRVEFVLRSFDVPNQGLFIGKLNQLTDSEAAPVGVAFLIWDELVQHPSSPCQRGAVMVKDG